MSPDPPTKQCFCNGIFSHCKHFSYLWRSCHARVIASKTFNKLICFIHLISQIILLLHGFAIKYGNYRLQSASIPYSSRTSKTRSVFSEDFLSVKFKNKYHFDEIIFPIWQIQVKWINACWVPHWHLFEHDICFGWFFDIFKNRHTIYCFVETKFILKPTRIKHRSYKSKLTPLSLKFGWHDEIKTLKRKFPTEQKISRNHNL